MAPVRIRHVVSFSSQDPKHPVENLLIESFQQPWLGCPRDRSRHLRVELQLERACHIGYIDIGNSGSAFLQIDVGRSIWPLEKGFATLLPTTTLMSPADARAMRNHKGVRMFKEADFLQAAAGEQWDRLRLTCTQPFNRQQQFGLSFIRIRSLGDEDGGPAAQDVRSSPSALHPRAEVGDPQAWSHTEERLQGAPLSPACMSRSARMLQLTAAKSRRRRQPPPSPPSPASSGSCPETLTTRLHPSQRGHQTPSRRLKMAEARKRRAQTGNSERHLTARSERDRPRTAQRPPETDTSTCPICAGHFAAALLPAHAATCGEAPGPHILLSSDDDDDGGHMGQLATAPPGSWVQCPLCGFRFPDYEIEQHAGGCGE